VLRQLVLALEIENMRSFKRLTLAGALLGLPLLAGAWQSPQEQPCNWQSRDLIGMKVVSEQGESLGKIEDVVVHPGGATSYAVLSIGGWLGMGDKLFAMPWSVLRTVERNPAEKDGPSSLVLPLTKERLKAAPGFDQKHWPALANPEWITEIDAFYADEIRPSSAKPIEGSVHNSVISWRATELRGANVQTPTGEKLGDIKEIVIDARGRVSYVALSVGGFLGLGDRLVAVPWDALKFSLAGEKGDKRLITLPSTKQQLEQAPQFKEGKEHCAEMCDPKWVSHVYEHFSCPPYWNPSATEGIKQGSQD
jgi:sporulation protein YlmC with PRC-barrel domain